MNHLVFRFLAVLALWMAGPGHLWAHEPAPAASAAPATIVLPNAATVISLDNRSEYWIDPTGRATIEEVAAQAGPWAVRGPGSHYNIDGKALWIRFDVLANTHTLWFLELASSGVDRAQLFYRAPEGAWVVQEAGDSKPVSAWPLPGRFPTFELSHTSGTPVHYWLRVEHTRVNFATAITLASQGALTAAREREQFLLGAYFGLVALIAFVTLANAAVHRDRLFAAYGIYVAALGAGQLAYLGTGAQYVWNDWLEWNQASTFVLPGLSAAVALWFVRTVTEPVRFSRGLDRLALFMIAAMLAALAVDTVMKSRPTFAVTMLMAVVSLAVVVAIIGLVWIRGDEPYMRFFALGFLPVLVLAMFPIARGLNLIPTSFFTRYGVSLGAAIEMPIVLYAMMLRGASRREAQVRAAALSRTDPLTGVAHHRTLLLRLENALSRARQQNHTCALLVVKLANQESISAQFGRETADRALVVAAALLRTLVSDVDLVARVDDQHFALLLEGPTTSVTAQACATRVVAAGLRESDALPGGVTLRFQVALAMLPDVDRDAAGVVQWLVGAADELHQGSRKSIRALNV